MKKELLGKMNKIAKAVGFLIILKSVVFSCIKENSTVGTEAEMELPNNNFSEQRAGTRFYKEDTFRFHYLKNSPHTINPDSLNSYNGNIFLILPKRQ